METDRKENAVVTVIIPTRNRVKEIVRCLSALEKSTAAFVTEVVVTDMGSEDGTGEAVRGFAEHACFDVRFFETGGNTGRCHALNSGIHLATTEFVAVVPPETELGKHCLERLLDALQEQPEAFCAEAGVLDEYSISEKSGARPRLGRSGRTVRVYRFSALEEIGLFDERLYKGLEEEDLELRAALYGYKTACVKKAFARVQAEEAEVPEERQLSEAGTELGNLFYLMYKNLPGIQHSINQFSLRSAVGKYRTFFVEKGKEDLFDAAMERGQDLCMDAEMSLLRSEEGLPAVVLPLPEVFNLEVKDSRVEEIYPLYLGKREAFSVQDLPACVRMQRVLMGKVFGTV